MPFSRKRILEQNSTKAEEQKATRKWSAALFIRGLLTKHVNEKEEKIKVHKRAKAFGQAK